MQEKTLVLLKPDLVTRNLIGTVLAIYEQHALKIEALQLLRPELAKVEAHYVEHVGRPYYERLVNGITGQPVVAVVLSGDEAISRVRTLNGATDPAKAEPQTIRGRFALSMAQNSVHASDSSENAVREIVIWFGSALEADFTARC